MADGETEVRDHIVTRVHRPAPSPNYAARRMLLSAGAITFVVIAATTLWHALRDDDSVPGQLAARWNALAVVTRPTGEVTLLDRDGAPTDTLIALGRAGRVEAAGHHLTIVGVDQITVVDLTPVDDDQARPAPLVVPIPRGADVVRLPTDRDHLLLAAGLPAGGTVTLVDALTGWTIELGADLPAARIFTATLRTDRAGRVIAYADASSFQTFVLRRPPDDAEPGDDGEPQQPTIENYAAQPLAVGDGVVVTSQVVGQQANIAVYTGDATGALPVPTGIPAGAVVADGALLAVTTEGQVVRIRRGDREPRVLATLALPAGSSVTGVAPVLDGTRLLVTGDGYNALVDLDGVVLHEERFVASRAPLAPAREWRCVVAGTGATTATLLAAGDGQPLGSPGDLSRVALTSASADGCTVLGDRAGITVVASPDGTAALGQYDWALLAPDGRAVIGETNKGVVQLIPLDDDLTPGDPVDLSGVVPTRAFNVLFVER